MTTYGRDVLENRPFTEAAQVGRFKLDQNRPGGSKLPESDRKDREVFPSHIRQLLAVLGSDLLTPVAEPAARQQSAGILFCRMKGAEGRGHRTPDAFVVLQGSTALLHERQWAKRRRSRKQLIANDTLIQKDGFYQFTKDVGF